MHTVYPPIFVYSKTYGNQSASVQVRLEKAAVGQGEDYRPRLVVLETLDDLLQGIELFP